MAASSIEETLPTQPQKTSDDHLQTSMDAQDDTENLPVTTALQPESLTDQSDLQSNGASVAGEKRKRTDPDSDAAKPNPDPSTNPLWKTSLCSYFRRHSGSCSHGIECRYAHGEEELRQRPDKSWDPTSERAKKVMKVGEEVKEEEVMMTEVVVDDDDDEVGNDGRDNELTKCLVHLPTKWNSDNLRNYLNELSVLFKSAKKKKGMTVGFVSFESTEQLRSSVEELQGKIIGKKNLKVADVIPRSFEKKIKSSIDCDNSSVSSAAFSLSSNDGEDAGNINDGSSTPNDSVLKGKSAREVVAPLAHMSYSDQLDHKKNSLLHVLKKLTRNARKACPHGVSLPEWILKSRDIGGIACSFEGIIESPIINGYRNKCEFSVGYSLEGKPTVGFMLGNFREGVTAVEEPENCPNVSRISCKYASTFQEFLQSSSLPIWNRFKNIGFWRQLTVREGRAPGKLIDSDNSDASISEVMLIVQVCSVGVESELMTSEFKRLAQAFAEGSVANSPPLPLTALVIQHHQGISNAAPADTPLQPLTIPKVHSTELEATNDAVEPRIHDYISNLKFCISPTAFFQVNTLAAEKLYSLAGDWAELGPDTLLFDICCGTGTIGLTLAHRVGMVVGIEMNASAVSDAQRNAEINGINNCKFICAKAEDVIGSLLKEYLKGTKKEEENVCHSNGNDGTSSASNQNEEISGAPEKNEETPGASEKSGENQGAKEKSDEVSETGERNALMSDKDQDPVVNHVPENDANGLETSEVASEKNGSKHNCCTSESGTKQFKTKPQPNKSTSSSSKPPSSSATATLKTPPSPTPNPFTFWFYFTLIVSIITYFFISLPSLSPPDPKSWFLSLPNSLRHHYSKGRLLKVQISGNLSPIEVFAVENGAKGNENVVIVHGLGLSSYSFRKVLDSLGSKGVRALAFDLPGNGFSDKSTAEIDESSNGVLGRLLDVYNLIHEKGIFWAFDQIIETGQIPYEEIQKHVPKRKILKPIGLGPEDIGSILGQIIDTIGLAPVHLVLHDSALLMAGYWVAENSGFVRSLTLIDTLSKPSLPLWLLELPVVREVILGSNFVYSRLINLCCSKGNDALLDVEAHRVLLKGLGGRRAVVSMGKKLNDSFDIGEWGGLDDLKSVPMQVIWSNGWSNEWSTKGRRVAEVLPQASFVEHSGGRWAQEDVADVVADSISQFISSLPPTVRKTAEEPTPEHIHEAFDESMNSDHHHHHHHSHGIPAGYMEGYGLGSHAW